MEQKNEESKKLQKQVLTSVYQSRLPIAAS
jgi:hypothetical protein